MARLPRLVVPGHAHFILQRGHNGSSVFCDGTDRNCYLQALGGAAAAERVAIHAYALADTEVQLLATPERADGLARVMQSVGRVYVGAYNLRHGRTGTLWDGRFCCAVIEPGAGLLTVLKLIDDPSKALATSAPHRTGGPRDPMLQDLAESWALGNTPFEREARWRELLANGVGAAETLLLRRAAASGWPIGSAAFLQKLALESGRAVERRHPGRRRKALTVGTADAHQP